ncbi:MAG: DNA replication regulator sld2 [Cirrosporium novae-zelandiae]|nr:MAG: DNA replication regulator sld2 [Cirrosporium novae-zelandiae]
MTNSDPLNRIKSIQLKAEALRQELKDWEYEFATANGGRKAGRDDIKANHQIASKYKAYNHLRNALSGKENINRSSSSASNHHDHHDQPKKRKTHPPSQQTSSTPRKIAKTSFTATPSKQLHPSQLDPYESPSTVRALFTPARLKTSIGPTPQKNGKVLGLFDLLPSRTPSRPKHQESPRKQLPVAETPTRKQSSAGNVPKDITKDEDEVDILEATRLLFRTPTAPCSINVLATTPSQPSVSKLQFTTPSFLRRSNQLPSTVNEENDPTLSPIAARMPKKPLFRGLSSIVQDLRKMEKEKEDDDLEMLREIEAEDMNTGNVQVGDSQVTRIGNEDEDDNGDEKSKEGLDRNGKPLRAWKKKGQKRQTRRSVLRPVRKPLKRLPVVEERDTGDEEGGEELVAIAETQVHPGTGHEDKICNTDTDELHSIHEEGSDSDGSFTISPSSKQTINQSKKPSPKPDEDKTSKVKKAVRKISATAHANYRALKIRNKNSKGRSRFGRGRR